MKEGPSVMKMNPSIFREYDIRGKADIDFDEEFAHTLARAVATHGKRYNAKKYTLGRDCRLTSDKYARAVIDGLKESGIEVLDIGVCPSPVFYYSVIFTLTALKLNCSVVNFEFIV